MRARCSRMARPPTTASLTGSSGTITAPAWRAVPGAAAADVRCRRCGSRPRRRGSTPRTASSSSRWPLPETPATPTSSPGWTMKVTSWSRAWPSGRVHRDAVDHQRRLSVGGGARSAGSGGGTLPTIGSTSSSSVRLVGSTPDSTILPPRSTVARSATARVSASLWVMRAMPRPSERSRSTTPSRASTSWGARALVGSSRMTTWASEQQDPEDLDQLALGDRQVPDDGVGVDRQAVALGALGDAGPGRPPRGSARRRTASSTFSATVRAGTRRRSWNTMPMPAARAAAGEPSSIGLAVDEHLALLGRVHPVEDLHERALAGAVLAEQGVDLAGADVEVDGVVGHERRRSAG